MAEENQATVAPATTNSANTGGGGGGGRVLLIIIIVLIILGLGGVVVYARYFNKTSTALSSIVPKALDANCKYNDADLCKFVNNWKAIKYFSANSISTFEGKDQKSIMKSIGEDRFQFIGYSGDTENMNIITIGDTTYTKDYSDGKWVKNVTKSQEQIATDAKDELKFGTEDDKTTYKKIGVEACGKLTCFKYQVMDPAITDSTQYILFDNKEYLLRKTIITGPDNNKSESEFDYSKISIDVPSPVKEGNPLGATGTSSSSSSIPASTSGASQADLEKAINEAQSQANTDASASTSTE